MKKSWVYGILVYLIITMSLIYSVAPTKNINMTLDGVKYRLEENYQEPVEVRIEGEYYKKLFSNKRFEGKIYINEYILYSLFLEFDENNSAILDSSSPWLTLRGKIFIDDDFDKMIIRFSESVIGDWEIEDRLLISAPARNREEAIEISKELFKDK